MSTLAVGWAVAVAGIIGFVGLVAPHLLRLAQGPDHRFLLPGSALLGAALLVCADLLARTVVVPLFEVVLMGRSPHLRGVESAHDRAIAREALRLVKADHLARRAYTTLSGGERQRVQLARVLAQIWEADDTPSTRYLLLDEPTAALDLAHQHAVLSLATRFAREQGVGVLAILHDLNLAALYADRIAMLKQGRLWIEGPPEMALAVEVVETVFAVRASVVRHPQRPDRLLVVSTR